MCKTYLFWNHLPIVLCLILARFTPSLLFSITFKYLTLTCYTTVVDCRHKSMVLKNHMLPHIDVFSPIQDDKVLENKKFGICFLSKTCRSGQYVLHCGHLPVLADPNVLVFWDNLNLIWCYCLVF